MKTVFILNPCTDLKKQYRFMEEVKQNYQGQRILIEKTEKPGHAQWIAQKYARHVNEPVHIFICGGDGTLHEAINGLMGNPNIYVSVLPMGTGNDFVKSFETLHIEDFLTLSNYTDPIPMDIDVLKVNGEYVINTVSFGFDVLVAKYANRIKKQIPVKGIVPYYLGMLATLKHPIGEEYKIRMDRDIFLSERFMFVVFGNGKYYGGGYQPCPHALFDDGHIDVCLIRPVTRRSIVRLAGAYKKGRHVDWCDLVSLHQAKKIHLDTGDKVIFGNLDGEVKALKNPVVEIEEQALHLLLPNRRKEK